MKLRTKVKFCQKTALFMAFTLIFQTFFPAVSLALTSGPAQPEFKAFQPATATDLVDLFTGDFSYNIPLFELPGPNGGYPFNLGYNAGITTDQEASWVGLGWSLNPGAVSRTVRGLPDDFSGDQVERKLDMKENRTWEFTVKPHVEIWGYDKDNKDRLACQEGSGGCPNLSLRISNNTYKGWNLGAGLGLNINDRSGSNYHYNYGLNFDFSSDGGAAIQPNFGIESQKYNSGYNFNASSEINSREGLRSFSLSYSTAWSCKLSESLAVGPGRDFNKGSNSFSSTFIPNGNAFPPAVKAPFEGYNFTGKVEPGGWTGLNSIGGSMLVSFSRQQIKDRDNSAPTRYTSPAYGYMFMKNRDNDPDNPDNAIIDFNREKEGVISDDAPNLGIPITTPDIYSVSGQGAGGIFRAYRSDIGILTDPSAESRTGGGTLGLEGNPGNGFDLGVDLGGNWSVSKTKRYKPSNYDNLDFDNSKSNVNYEPVYFKSMGGGTSEALDYYSDWGGESAGRLKKIDNNLLSRLELSGSPTLELNNGEVKNITALNNKREDRKPRSSSMQYVTNNQLLDNGDEILPEYQVECYSVLNDFNTTSALSRESYDQNQNNPHDNGHHIAGFTKVEESGYRYNYALPVRNLTQREVLFSTQSTSVIQCGDEPLISPIPHSGSEITYKSNNNPTDEYYDETITPEYTQSHLLTSVLGTDYIDSDGTPGPSDGDHGYWVKMNYFKPSDNMKWRAPFEGANYLEGRYSIRNDNKGGFTYGEREQFYLAKVETKTHYAEFHLVPREDAMGAASFINDSGTGTTSYKLDKIKLYSKLDPVRPLKVVHFDYDYSLCQGVLNSQNNGGKLTLKKVWFTYDNSNRGRLSPYHFDYDESNSDSNPNYKNFAYDRWGTYKDIGNNAACTDMEFPYTEQNKTTADQYSSAWSLRKITLPSGAVIDVEYESDDYAYVQDRLAMQMFPISGAGTSTPTNNRVELNDNDLRIFFTPPATFPIGATRCSVKNFIEDLHGIEIDESNDCAIQQGAEPQIFYKVYIDLLNQGDDEEFIEGYALISDYGVENGNPFIEVKPVTDNNYHPFSLAAWQLLKLEFSGKLSNVSLDDHDETSFREAIGALGRAFSQLLEIFNGFYSNCDNKDYGREINLERSFIRLNVPNKVKYGGGCRVKEVQFNDNWNSSETVTYGQTYKYTNDDGSSSGVAINEPNTGYEECPLKYAKLYQENNLLKSDGNFFFEYPINQSYYPSASVGYSKVEVKSLASEKKSGTRPADLNFNYGTTGATVHEFYTAKDFPTIVDETSLDRSIAVPRWLSIGVGTVTTDKYTGTQGYSIILNDMHGKPYKKTHYAQKDNGDIIKEQPVNQVVYTYHEGDERVEGFHNNRRKQRTLNNDVNVLVSHKSEPGDVTKAHIEKQTMGVDFEFFTDINESTINGGQVAVGINVDFSTPWFFGLSGWPSVSSNNSRTRTAVTNKVIYKTGILKQADVFDGQSHITTNNEVFDPLTGSPLLTTVNNSFDKKVYNYSVPAYMPYASMGGAFENWGLAIGALESDIHTVSSSCGGSHYITGIPAATRAKLIPGDEFIVLNDAGNGIGRGLYKFENSTGVYFIFNGLQLATNQEITLLLIRSGKRNQLNAGAGNIVALSNPTENWTAENCTVPVGGSNTVTVNYKKGNNILSATTNTYSDGWVLDEINHCPGQAEQIAFDDDEYCIGTKGIWKPKQTFTYVGNRKLEIESQGILVDNIKDAGTVDNVPLFNWENAFFADCSSAENWKAASKTVKCAKNGLENESKNILGIYSAAMYGYGDILPTAVAGNSRYREMAFEGFETMNTTGLPYTSGNFTFVGASHGHKTGNENYSVIEGVSSGSTSILTDKPFVVGLDDSNNNLYDKVELFLKSESGDEVYQTLKDNQFSISSHGVGNIKIDFTAGTLCNLNASEYYIGDINFWYHCDPNPLPMNHDPNMLISTDVAHSGNKSLKVNTGNVSIGNQHRLSLESGKKYVVSGWVHVQDYAKTHPTYADGSLGIGISTATENLLFEPDGNIIDGWQRIEGIFTMNGELITIDLNSLNANSNATYYDDLRIYPLDGAMESYVYDTQNYRLKAKLDNNNYATFYAYDEEGNLTLIKKETEKGIKTIQEGRTYLNPNAHAAGN